MEEDERVPLILGRPFLAMGRALIDVEQGVVDLRVADEVVTFNVYKNAKHPGNGDEFFSCEIIDELMCEEFARISRKDTLEAVIMDGINIDELDIDSESYLETPELLSSVAHLEHVSPLSTKRIWREDLVRDVEPVLNEQHWRVAQEF